LQEFGDAANAYEQLVKIYPEIPEYRLHLVHCLFNATLYEQALEACKFTGNCDHVNLNPELREQVRLVDFYSQISENQYSHKKLQQIFLCSGLVYKAQSCCTVLLR